MPNGTAAMPPSTLCSSWKPSSTRGPDEAPVVSIILDGENAWEHYPYNGYYFFDDLYGLLAEHPRIRTTTYAELLARPSPPAATVLPNLTAGSWVYGTLSTWIGDEAKNRGWDLLCEAKQSCDRVLASGRLDSAQVAAVNAQLAICESSDWFWWFGDYNPSAAVASFDSLYRRNLARLYEPAAAGTAGHLDTPICAGSATATGGSMRRVTCFTILKPFMTISLLFGVHAHQPVGNFPAVIDDAHAQLRHVPARHGALSGVPLQRAFFRLAARRAVRALPRRHGAPGGDDPSRPGRVVRLRRLRAGAGGDPASRPRHADRHALDKIERRFGMRPSGAWLTERVWESSVVTSLVATGIRYVAVDDYHFLCAGESQDRLDSFFSTDEDGRRLDLFPISEGARYRLPFSPAGEAVAWLEDLARQGRRAAIYFDDIEKFGIWPETYEWVFEKGWLTQFVEGVLASPLIRTETYAEYHARERTRGIVYLPTTSYIEMNEWTLPAQRAHEYHALVEAEKAAGRFEAHKPFLRGGIWRNFMSRYSEANWMHKRMLGASRRLAALPPDSALPNCRSTCTAPRPTTPTGTACSAASTCPTCGAPSGTTCCSWRRRWSAWHPGRASSRATSTMTAISKPPCATSASTPMCATTATRRWWNSPAWHWRTTSAIRCAPTRRPTTPRSTYGDAARRRPATTQASPRPTTASPSCTPSCTATPIRTSGRAASSSTAMVDAKTCCGARRLRARRRTGRWVSGGEGWRIEKSYALEGDALRRHLPRRRGRLPATIETEINLAMPSCDGFGGRYVLADGSVPGGFGDPLQMLADVTPAHAGRQRTARCPVHRGQPAGATRGTSRIVPFRNPRPASRRSCRRSAHPGLVARRRPISASRSGWYLHRRIRNAIVTPPTPVPRPGAGDAQTHPFGAEYPPTQPRGGGD
jgi:hypothetical protein